ncbi:MAG: hypothetical protein MZV65_53485 [Chromatiales bacterium]|nr:hypothetical protein [Chromatiales bacterium]
MLQSPKTRRCPVVTRRAPRQVRMFSTPTQITFTEDPVRQPHRARADRRRPARPAVGDRQGAARRARSTSVTAAHHDHRRTRRGRLLHHRRRRAGRSTTDARGSAARSS